MSQSIRSAFPIRSGQVTITGVFAKAKVGKSLMTTPPDIQIGDLVVKPSDPSYVGRVIDIDAPQFWNKNNRKWRLKIKPIHATTGRTTGKARWCAARAWRAVSPLELLATQAGTGE